MTQVSPNTADIAFRNLFLSAGIRRADALDKKTFSLKCLDYMPE